MKDDFEDDRDLIILKDFENCKINSEDDEDICLAQTYEFESLISNEDKKWPPFIPTLQLWSNE